MVSENSREHGKLSDLESKLSKTQRINNVLIKEQVLAKKIIELVFKDRLFLQKAEDLESDELHEFVSQELHKLYAQPAAEAKQPEEDAKKDFSILDSESVKRAEAEGLLKQALQEMAPLKRFYDVTVKKLSYADQQEIAAVLDRTVEPGTEKHISNAVEKFVLEKILQANVAEQELMKQAIKTIVGKSIYSAAMEIEDVKERYSYILKSFNNVLSDSLKKKYEDMANAATRRLMKHTSVKEHEIKTLAAQVEELKKSLDEEKAKTAQYMQPASGNDKNKVLVSTIESLQKENLELSQAFNTIYDLIEDHEAFERNLDYFKKIMEGK